jgi:iron-sulfur cluster assembly protein
MEEEFMLEVTEKAVQKINEFLKDRDGVHTIRIILAAAGGCSGPLLRMTLDEAREGDQIIEEHGITFLMEKDLLDQAQPVSVDFIETNMGAGFKIDSRLSEQSACGTCCSCS